MPTRGARQPRNRFVNTPSSGAGERPPARTALVLAFATIYLVWGSTYLGIRVAVETLPPFLMAAARFLIAGGLLYGFLRLRGSPAPTRGQWRDQALIGAFLLLGGNGLVSWAEQSVPSGIAALLVGVGPVFTVLVEWLWPGGQRPRFTTFLGLALGVVGVAWLAAPWQSVEEGGLPLSGSLALVAACFLWAVGSIFSRRTRHPTPALLAAALQMLCGGGFLLLASLLGGEFSDFAPAAVSGRSWGAFLYLTAIGSLVGFSTFAWLMKHSTPALVSTYAYVNPVVAVLLGALLLNEPLSPRLGLATVIVVAAVALITLGKRSPRS